MVSTFLGGLFTGCVLAWCVIDLMFWLLRGQWEIAPGLLP